MQVLYILAFVPLIMGVLSEKTNFPRSVESHVEDQELNIDSRSADAGKVHLFLAKKTIIHFFQFLFMNFYLTLVVNILNS